MTPCSCSSVFWDISGIGSLDASQGERRANGVAPAGDISMLLRADDKAHQVDSSPLDRLAPGIRALSPPPKSSPAASAIKRRGIVEGRRRRREYLAESPPGRRDSRPRRGGRLRSITFRPAAPRDGPGVNGRGLTRRRHRKPAIFSLASSCCFEHRASARTSCSSPPVASGKNIWRSQCIAGAAAHDGASRRSRRPLHRAFPEARRHRSIDLSASRRRGKSAATASRRHQHFLIAALGDAGAGRHRSAPLARGRMYGRSQAVAIERAC